jgi:hypothetical protein
MHLVAKAAMAVPEALSETEVSEAMVVMVTLGVLVVTVEPAVSAV